MKRIKSKNRQLASVMLRVCNLYTAYYTMIALNRFIPEYYRTPRHNMKRLKSVERCICVRICRICFNTRQVQSSNQVGFVANDF
jgi:hypothetical protein